MSSPQVRATLLSLLIQPFLPIYILQIEKKTIFLVDGLNQPRESSCKINKETEDDISEL